MSTNDTYDTDLVPDVEIPRRSFMYKAVTAGIGMVVGLVPALAGLLPIADPIRPDPNGTEEGEDHWFPIAGIDALPADGSPQKFPVFADKIDAWNTIRNTRVGAVYMKRDKDGAVIAWNVVCPHAGCFVSAQSDGSFVCPCHNSEFDASGVVRKVNKEGRDTKSPRDMDLLGAKVEGGKIFVQFKNYQAAVPEKNAIAQPIVPPTDVS